MVFAAVLALDSADKATIGVNAVKLQAGFGLGRSEIGLLLAVRSLVGAAATIPAGMLVDRVCRTRLLAWAVAFWALAMVDLALKPNRLLASCCKVLVVKGAAGLRVLGEVVISETLKIAPTKLSRNF